MKPMERTGTQATVKPYAVDTLRQDNALGTLYKRVDADEAEIWLADGHLPQSDSGSGKCRFALSAAFTTAASEFSRAARRFTLRLRNHARHCALPVRLRAAEAMWRSSAISFAGRPFTAAEKRTDDAASGTTIPLLGHMQRVGISWRMTNPVSVRSSR